MLRSSVQLLFVLVFVCTFYACTSGRSEPDNSNRFMSIDHSELSSLMDGKVRGKDMLQELFDEAVEKDAQLKAIFEQTDTLAHQQARALSPFQEYTSTNDHYWYMAKGYVETISDTTLKATLTELISGWENEHNRSLLEHHQTALALHGNQEKVKNLKTTMMVLVTHKMMEQYQEDERPSLEDMQEMAPKYDRVFNLMRAHLEPIDPDHVDNNPSFMAR